VSDEERKGRKKMPHEGTDDAARREGSDPPGELLARDVMRVGLPVIVPGDSLSKAARLMDSAATRELPVLAGTALVGILTRTDMEPHRGHLEWTTAGLAMTPDPVTVAPDAPLGSVVSLLLARGFNSVPVTTDGELLGMIARTDIIRALATSA
jgi:CIC family chloride channel protein